jgi:hypothetical protein
LVKRGGTETDAIHDGGSIHTDCLTLSILAVKAPKATHFFEVDKFYGCIRSAAQPALRA